MTIGSPATSLLRALGGLTAPREAARGGAAGPAARSDGPETSQGPERRDRVEISDEAKALQAAGGRQSPQAQARIQELQIRDAGIRGPEETAGRREADAPKAAVGEGGSFDLRFRGYSQPPAPAVNIPSLVDLFG